MPRGLTGSYMLPNTVNPVEAGEVIAADWANATLDDIANALASSLDREGRGGMLSPLKLAPGTVSAPGLVFGSEPTSGMFRPGAGEVSFSILGDAILTLSGTDVVASTPLSVEPATESAHAVNRGQLAAEGGADLLGVVGGGTVQDALDAQETALSTAEQVLSENLATVADGFDLASRSYSDPAAVVSGPATSNKANPAVVDPLLANTAAQLHRLYNSGTGALSAQAPSSLGTFAVTRKYDVVAGTEYTVSMHGAPLGFFFYFSGSPFLQFFNTDGSFHSQITSGFTRGSWDRTVTFTVPAGAERVAFNLRNFAEFSNTNPMTGAALDTCLVNVMLNEGATALPFVAYTDGVFTPTTALFDPVSGGNMVVAKQGEYIYVRARAQLSATRDVVWRVRVGHGLGYNRVDSRSGVVDFYGIRFIDRTQPSTSTIAAFNQSTEIHCAGVDESCPTRINSMFLAGGHGVIGYRSTSAAHGKTNVDVGSRWSDGTSEWVLYRVSDVNTLVFVRRYTGSVDKWTISSATFGSGTLTHVAGATNTGAITVTTPTQEQFVPILRDYLQQLRVDNVEVTTDNVYRGSRVVLSEVYGLMNMARQQDALIAAVGSATPVYDTAAEQVRFFYEFEWNEFGAMSVRASQGVKEAYRRGAALDYWGGIQLQRLSLSGDSTGGMHEQVHLFVPDVAPVSGYDLEAVADITANVATVYVPRSGCDNPSDPVSHFAQLGKNGSGVTLSGHLYGYSRVEGLGVPAVRAVNVTDVMYFSPAEKQYPIAIDAAAGDAVAGDVELVTSFRAPFLPTDPTLTVPGVVVTMSGKTFLYISAHASATNKAVAVPESLSGRSVTLVKGHANFTLLSTYVAAGEVRVTIAGGYADAVLQIGA